ncbi:MAG: tetratricopeptide repeat protein, partial [Planctomycetota bacterium]
MTIAFRKSLVGMLEGAARRPGEPVPMDNPLERFDRPERMARLSDGVVAWRVLPRKEEGDWVRFSWIAYFEDINRVRIYEEEPQAEGIPARRLTHSFRYERRPDGGTLRVERGKAAEKLRELRGKLSSEVPGQADSRRAVVDLLRPVFGDFRYAVTLAVPGRIDRAEGLSAGPGGRTARFVLDGEAVLKALGEPEAGSLESLERFSRAAVSWTGGADVPEDWKKELAAAKEEWARSGGGASRPAPAAEAAKPPARRESLGADADRLSEEEVNRAYARAQIKTAQAYLRSGKPQQAREILESLLAEFPKLPESEEARRLL